MDSKSPVIKNRYTREAILIANEISGRLEAKGFSSKEFSIEGYGYDLIADTHKLLINVYNNGGKTPVTYDLNYFATKEYFTPALVQEWAKKDMGYLTEFKDLDRVNHINDVIERLLGKVDNEIAKITIKKKLAAIGEELRNSDTLSTENIYECFADAMLSLDNVNLMDGLAEDVYSQKFYHRHLLGNRENDNIEAFEIMKSLVEKDAGSDLGMCFLDINIFKTINDKIGHDIGDKIIVELSKQLKDVVGDKGIISRRGGDEFIVIAPVDVLRDLASSQLSLSTVEKNNAALRGFIDNLDDNDARKSLDVSDINISMTVGVKKIDFDRLDKDNCAVELTKIDSITDLMQSRHKDVSHFVFGAGSRGDTVSEKDFSRSLAHLMRNLHQELGMKSIEVFGHPINITQANEVEHKAIDEQIAGLEIKKMAVYSELNENASLQGIIDGDKREQLDH